MCYFTIFTECFVRPFIAFTLILSLTLFGAVAAFAQDPADAPVEKQIMETAEELSVVMLENLKQFLENELNKLKQKKDQSEKAVQDKIGSLEEIIKKYPDNAEARFVLAEIYDQMDDGANAIIHTKMAEKIYIDKKDIKGIAEARRNLRDFYEKYGFRPEDFELTH